MHILIDLVPAYLVRLTGIVPENGDWRKLVRLLL